MLPDAYFANGGAYLSRANIPPSLFVARSARDRSNVCYSRASGRHVC